MNEGPPKLPEGEKLPDKKREITTPEKAAEMTRERRIEAGLKEIEESTPEEEENRERSIEELLTRLDEYDFNSFDEQTQEEWYYVEMEARAGKDRELAEVVLKRFLETLEENSSEE